MYLKNTFGILSLDVLETFSVSLFFSMPIVEWPFPPPTLCRIYRMPLSTATMTAAWRTRRLPAVSHRLVLASDPWPCLRTTMREPPQMGALEKPNIRKMVQRQYPPLCLIFMNIHLYVNVSNRLCSLSVSCRWWWRHSGVILLCNVSISELRRCGTCDVDLLCLLMTALNVIGLLADLFSVCVCVVLGPG